MFELSQGSKEQKICSKSSVIRSSIASPYPSVPRRKQTYSKPKASLASIPFACAGALTTSMPVEPNQDGSSMTSHMPVAFEDFKEPETEANPRDSYRFREAFTRKKQFKDEISIS